MDITVFSKKRNTKDGRTFYSYLGSLTKKDGTILVATIKFRDNVIPPDPAGCPCNICVEKSNANLSSKKFARLVTDVTTGELIKEEALSYTLWVNDYSVGDPYVDHSLDDF